jgi:membrane protease YdiL (CAAX protease family)
MLAVALTLGWTIVSLGGWLALTAVFPDLDRTIAAIAVTALLAVGTMLAVAIPGWWNDVGLTGGWRNLHLLIVPALIVFAPLLAGTGPLEWNGFWLLVLGYALTGFAEETMFRGLHLRLLARYPVVSAALISSLLFGLVHLNNIVIRGNPAIIAAQAIGAFTFGIGYAALRMRINTIWPLIGLHMLHDLILHIGTLPLIPVDVAQDVVLVCYGAWLLWRMRGRSVAEVSAGTVSVPSPGVVGR